MKILKAFPGPAQGVISLAALTLNTIVWTTPLFAIALLKAAGPMDFWRKFWTRVLDRIALSWVWVNNTVIKLTKNVKWEVEGANGLDRKGWYLVIANHQSWLDIVVLQKVFYKKIPMIKFFLKKELIFVPLLGLAWWALDFPFMKRYSRSFLKKHPHLKGKDLETTKKACAKFEHIPVSIMNFVEGTRFTCSKAEAQNSPYNHLLKPKAAGVAFVLGAMGERLDQILNVTIAYPKSSGRFWSFLCGKVNDIKVKIESIPITPEIQGDYFTDGEFRLKFQEWLNTVWERKDNLMESMVLLPCPEKAASEQ